MFRGANSINLDSKGRIAVPAKYRGAIVDSARSHMVVTCDPYDNCLLIFPLEHWEATETDLQSLSNSKPLHRRLKRIMLAHATEVDMDSSGRLLIPGVLRERANLNKEVMLIGQGKTFQLWNEAEWNRLTEEDLDVLSSDELDSDELPDLYY
ncbi:division/cell wall cluster transcriptional repressor MraZ [Aliikangiella marina]|uniref:Transcriptional regulator MraZ n=1 Tax=Aliikangiella marina TaxID=1712262 RepID=A0A545TDH7_9GAMM|nr:division/cell wall cluster transcriptional repressor MraZ [Aliikangiella marina]TQV75273.1 division/cell wall cluster transcriptional repressor MraZ [Aliikangiella marina]